ncbi:hypothetical protein [Haloimpatiens lingqiaonensis]|uniref:hypothetical protein n=1 Tax=Haloimpatiens lingqiaonensis TaxID=1380675 RepID=UPI001FAA04C2|nr:hypothetical protein [Haloimpatiens lingqiaonensis]
MLKKWRKVIATIIVLTLPFAFTGCNKIDKLKVKMGLMNEDFQYIKDGRINKIVIQSTRDKGFRFIVEDKKAISGMYDILSSAKKVNTKTTLKPDYIFEMYENDESVHQFKYIVGIDRKSSGGNLYDEDNNVYIVSGRLDNDIIKNFWNIRVPEKFSKVYYGSLIQTLKKYSDTYSPNSTIGIELNDDVEARKFLLSSDIEQFKEDIKSKKINAEIVEDENKKYDIVMKISTEGYKSFLYKGIVQFEDNTKNQNKKYYIWNVYDKGDWEIRIFQDKAPVIDDKEF